MDGEDILIPYDQEEIMYTIECDLFMKSCCELYEWEEDEIPSWSN
ncbi:hypothetical protein [Vallitalea guaymasensis]|nr:hypothetical protein [Vallitalea guaymasensis]